MVRAVGTTLGASFTRPGPRRRGCHAGAPAAAWVAMNAHVMNALNSACVADVVQGARARPGRETDRHVGRGNGRIGRHVATSTASASHDVAAVAAGARRWAITTPVISDQVSIPDGVVGEVVEVTCEVGDVVTEAGNGGPRWNSRRTPRPMRAWFWV